MTDLPAELEEVRVLRLQPGDVIIARVAEHVGPDVAYKAVEKLKGVFPGHEVLVCAGLTLEVARPGSATWAAECEEFGCTDPDHSSRIVEP